MIKITLFQAVLYSCCVLVVFCVGDAVEAVQYQAHDEDRTPDHDTSTKHGVAAHEPRSSTSNAPHPHEGSGYEQYRGFMNKLAQFNVDEYVDLPMIAVMGDTSSGKSSLLSMISMVELPSNDKLTTRCPIRLQMHTKESKSATVKIIWKDIPEGPDFEFIPRNVTEANWDDLTGYISGAQKHIVAKQNKEVARDVVSVEMTCPHSEDLTLIDLPGMERIMAEALKVDPDTKRTIPVLTKPDLIDSGAEGGVKELLLGEKTEHFEIGFHMVKGRGQEALNKKTTIEEGLAQEASFFYNKEPWRGIEDKTLFGTTALRVKLGKLQMKLIRLSFHNIVSEMKEKRDSAVSSRQELGVIPSNLTEKRALFRKVTDDFCRSIGPLETLSKSRLANTSNITVGVDVIAFVQFEEIRKTARYLKGDKVYFTGIRRKFRDESPPPDLTLGDVYEKGNEVMIMGYNNHAFAMEPVPLELV